jgi:hypothetical protein
MRMKSLRNRMIRRGKLKNWPYILLFFLKKSRVPHLSYSDFTSSKKVIVISIGFKNHSAPRAYSK